MLTPPPPKPNNSLDMPPCLCCVYARSKRTNARNRRLMMPNKSHRIPAPQPPNANYLPIHTCLSKRPVPVRQWYQSQEKEKTTACRPQENARVWYRRRGEHRANSPPAPTLVTTVGINQRHWRRPLTLQGCAAGCRTRGRPPSRPECHLRRR